MQSSFYSNIENLWDHLLSRKSELIRAAFESLSPQGKQDVLAHMQRMVSEAGWHPEQAASARAALETLKNTPPEDKPEGYAPGA